MLLCYFRLKTVFKRKITFILCWGNFCSLLLFFVFSLTCYRVFFTVSLRYFVSYAPLLFAVCKFRYSLLPRPYLLPVFFTGLLVSHHSSK